MKKLLEIISIIFILSLFSSCKQKIITDKVPLDTRYTEAYTAIETDVRSEYSTAHDGFVPIPYTYTVYYHEKWEVLYLVVYEDDTTKERWEEVSKYVYRDVDDLLCNVDII